MIVREKLKQAVTVISKFILPLRKQIEQKKQHKYQGKEPDHSAEGMGIK